MAETMNEQMREAALRLVELLAEFDSPDFVPGVWPERYKMDEAGKRVNFLPYPDYHPAVEEFRNRIGAFAAEIHPYDPLPEDADANGIEFSVLGTTFPLEYFESASVNQIRRYFRLLNRGERFCDGHIDGEFRAGKVQAALRRLAQLLSASTGK